MMKHLTRMSRSLRGRNDVNLCAFLKEQIVPERDNEPHGVSGRNNPFFLITVIPVVLHQSHVWRRMGEIFARAFCLCVPTYFHLKATFVSQELHYFCLILKIKKLRVMKQSG